jgi:hypothetical protein
MAKIRNASPYEPLVVLKHFGPDCGMPQKTPHYSKHHSGK